MVESVSPDEIGVGDIVLVGRWGRLCSHRVIATPECSTNPYWTTQGDAMLVCDLPVAASELLGRVTHLLRSGKQIPVSRKLGPGSRFMAMIARRSFTVARALVCLHGIMHSIEKPVLPCQ